MNTEFNKKVNTRFTDYWEKKKDNKRGIYIRYFFIWGIVVASFVYAFNIKFNFSNFEIDDYVLRIVFWSLGSQLLAFLHIRTREKHYRKIKELEKQQDQ